MLKKKSVLADYILWTAVLLIAVTAIYFVYDSFKKSKEKAKEVKQPEVISLGGNIEVVKTENGYKILIDKEFKLVGVKVFYFKIKDENGNTICTCHYKKNGDIVCDNCTVEQ